MADGESNNNVWKYVGIGCLVMALIGACGVGSCMACGAVGFGGAMAAMQAPAEASHAFLREVRTGAVPAAYARMAPAYRATHTEADFAARIAAIPALTTATDATLNNRAVNGGIATMSGTLDGATCAVVPCSVMITLHEEDGTFVIDSVIAAGEVL